MSTTKPDTDTGWTDKFPVIKGFYLVRTEQYRELPAEFDGIAVAALHGARFYRDDTAGHHPEFLGPFTASDFEQLIRLRGACEAAEQRLADNERWWNQEEIASEVPESYRQAFKARAQVTRNTLDQIREALTRTGEQS